MTDQRPTLLAALLLMSALTLLLAQGMPVAGAAEEALEPGGTGLGVVDVDTSGAPEIRLTVAAPATLADERLPTEAFAVFEDGDERPVQVSRLSDEALQVVLLLDVSGSMAGAPLQAVKDAALGFVERMPPGVVVAVTAFATEPVEASPFTDDRDRTRAAITALEAGGRTATYDAVLRALAQFEGLADGRRVVVLLSDGEDNQSTTSLDAAASALADSGVTLQVVELQTRFSDAAALRALASAGRGDVVSIDDPAALAGAYDGIASKLLSHYLVAYASEGAGPVQVLVRVEHGDLRADAAVRVDLPVPAPEPEPVETASPEARPTATPTPAAAAPAGPRPQRVEPAGPVAALLHSPWSLGAGAVLVFVALSLAALLLLAPRQVRSSLHGAVWDRRAAGARQGGLSSVGDWAEEHIERSLQRRDLGTRINHSLEQSGILLKPSEAVVVAVAAALAALALGFVVSGPLLGLPLAAVTVLGLRGYVNARRARRRSAFVAQLPDTLQLLSGSLRAGYGLLQAVDSVSREAESPTAEEFRRLVVETRLGRDLATALRAMDERMASDDFAWVVQAIEIHRDVGGDLAEVLDRVAETIRSRDQIARQVRALSAEGRLSAKVLLGLPLLVMAGMALLNPGYLHELTGSVPGRIMLAFAGLLMTVGTVWINRLVQIRF